MKYYIYSNMLNIMSYRNTNCKRFLVGREIGINILKRLFGIGLWVDWVREVLSVSVICGYTYLEMIDCQCGSDAEYDVGGSVILYEQCLGDVQ